MASRLLDERQRVGAMTTATIDGGWVRGAMRTLGDAADEVFKSARFQDGVARLAEQLSRPRSEVAAEAEAGLREIVTIQNPVFTSLFDHVLGPMHTRAFTIDTEPDSLERLRALDRENALVFLPTHRSYADAFVLTEVLQRAGLPRNHILGGNNVGFFPLGTILRRSGGVLIRRSFRDDAVYKLVVREYIHHLVASGNNLEWYIEGGRSRTGKLLPPKYGLLHYLVDAVEQGGARDLLLVPVSTTYEQLHEVTAMVAEESGAVKAKEGIAWLLDYARTQQKWIGKAYVRFGEPLSLREALGPERARGGRFATEKVAFEMSQRINRVTLVTAPALVTLALLGVHDSARTLAEVHALVSALLGNADARKLSTEHLAPLRALRGTEDTLASLMRAGVVSRYDGGLAPVFKIEPGKHTVAAFYRNSAIHWFVNRGIIELGLLDAAREAGPDSLERGWTSAFAFRDLLKFEFFFSDKDAFREEIRAEALLLDPAFREKATTQDGRRRMLEEAPFLIAHRIFAAFLEAYFLIADRLADLPANAPVDRHDLVNEALAVGRQYVLEQRLRNPECLSRELFRNALSLAANRGLLETGGEAIATGRSAFRAELLAAVRSIGEIEAIDRRRGGRGDDLR